MKFGRWCQCCSQPPIFLLLHFYCVYVIHSHNAGPRLHLLCSWFQQYLHLNSPGRLSFSEQAVLGSEWPLPINNFQAHNGLPQALYNGEHWLDGTHKLADPVSKTTLNACEGEPMLISPKYCVCKDKPQQKQHCYTCIGWGKVTILYFLAFVCEQGHSIGGSNDTERTLWVSYTANALL